MDNKKYNLAFVVDAFQPFHNGHKVLIDEALKRANRVVVLVENACESGTQDNPLPYTFRVSLIKNVYSKNLEVYPLNTTKSDDISPLWADTVIRQIKKYCDATPDLFVTDTTRRWRAEWFEKFHSLDVNFVSKATISNLEVLKMYREVQTDDDLIKITSFVPYSNYNFLTLTKTYIEAASPDIIRFVELSGYGSDIPDLLGEYFSKHPKKSYANRYGDIVTYIDDHTLEVEINDRDELSQICEDNKDKFVKIKGKTNILDITKGWFSVHFRLLNFVQAKNT